MYTVGLAVMREIKFRGKRLDNGDWVEGDLTRRKSRFSPQLDTTYGISDEYGTFCAVDSATVGQYTGLQDENGVDIYECDLLEHDMEVNGVWETYKASEVVFDSENGCFSFENDEGVLTEYRNLVVVGIVVAGNICDNPRVSEAV